MDCPLQLYKGKLKEALTLVPNISPERRSEAIRFWNDLAEQFQEIVTDSRPNCNDPYIEDNGTNSVYPTLGCCDQTININTTTSEGEASNNVINNMSNALDSAHSSCLIETDLKQVNSQMNHYHHDDNVYKFLSENSYMTQTTTSFHYLSSSGDSNSHQLAVKEEQVRDNLSIDKQTPRNQHTCDICGKSGFSTKGNLKRHLRAHSGEKPFKCEFCESSFTEKKSLKIHVRRHTGEKPYKCEICGKLFSQTGVLQSHMALHLNERKFDCQKCGKAFRQRSQLKLHLMRHDGVKRLECSTCNAKFLTKGDLERHCRIHTGERPYECKICGKTFTRQQSLNEHMNRHTGRKPYDCKFCDKTFSEMSACYKHAKTHTKQDQNQQQSQMQHCPSNINAS